MWTCRHGGPRGYRGILWWRAYYKQHASCWSCSRVSWVDAEIEDGPWESASEVPRWCWCCHRATLGEPAAWTILDYPGLTQAASSWTVSPCLDRCVRLLARPTYKCSPLPLCFTFFLLGSFGWNPLWSLIPKPHQDLLQVPPLLFQTFNTVH